MVEGSFEGSPESHGRKIRLLHCEIPVGESTRKRHLTESSDVVHSPVKSKEIDQMDVNSFVRPSVIAGEFVEDASDFCVVEVLVRLIVPQFDIAWNRVIDLKIKRFKYWGIITI